MNKLAHAIAITATAFDGVLDKGGQPYILHCFEVMRTIDGDEDDKCGAVMHDLVEDTDWTILKLRAEGFSERTLNTLSLLTHHRDVAYMDYIKALSICPRATKIKLADLTHNSNITRLTSLTKKTFDKMEKYFQAYTYLKST